MTTKLQVTLPKALADRYRIRPGDEIDWVAAGEFIRVIPNAAKEARTTDPALQLEIFDQATKRLKRRQKGAGRRRTPSNRGWKREDLYIRGRSR